MIYWFIMKYENILGNKTFNFFFCWDRHIGNSDFSRTRLSYVYDFDIVSDLLNDVSIQFLHRLEQGSSRVQGSNSGSEISVIVRNYENIVQK